MTTTAHPLASDSTSAHLPEATLFAGPRARRSVPPAARREAEFVAMIIHALRTPLTSLVDCTEVLQNPDASTRGRDPDVLIRQIGLNATRLLVLVDNLERSV